MARLFGLTVEYSDKNEIVRLTHLTREFFLISVFRLIDRRPVKGKSNLLYRKWMSDFLRLDAESLYRFCNGEHEIVHATIAQVEKAKPIMRPVGNQEIFLRRVVDNFLLAIANKKQGTEFVTAVSAGRPILDVLTVNFESESWTRFFRSVFSESSYGLAFGSDAEEDSSPNDFFRPLVFQDPKQDFVYEKPKKISGKRAAAKPIIPSSTSVETPTMEGLRIEHDMSPQLDAEGRSRLQGLRNCWNKSGHGGQTAGDDFLVERWVVSEHKLAPSDVLTWLKDGQNKSMDEKFFKG